MFNQLNLYDHTHHTIKRCKISLLLVFLFLFPPLQLLIIPFYYSQNSLFSKVFKFDFKKINPFIIIYLIVIILVINLVSGCFFSDYSPQKNVNQLSITQEITTIQLLTILILAPVIEEFYFRGILFNYFEKRNGKLFILITTSLLFSIIHFNISATPTLVILGISLGLIKLITGSMLITIIMHSLFNCIMLLMIF
jgi:membrane protease YdiL (CAAX protease family)